MMNDYLSAAPFGVNKTPMDISRDQVRMIAFNHCVSVKAIMSPNQERRVAHARFAAYVALRDRGLSLPQIGHFFKRDHTTVLHGLRRAKELGL